MTQFPSTLRASLGGALLLASLAALAPPASAADAVSFKGKSVTVIVGTTAGGSTDASARLIAPFLSQYLPGQPDLVVQNRPGAHGMTAMNVFANQVKPDGLTMIVGSSSQIDPINYRVSQSNYDPTTFPMIGGVGIGGTVLLIRTDSLPRLTGKNGPPLAMASTTGVPRSGMQMAAWGTEYLGWNVKWVPGYRGTPDLILALARGEADMTSLANTEMRPELLDKSKYRILYQSGSNGGTEPTSVESLAGVPLFADAMKGKITDPLAQKAFEYWRNISSVSKWAALPPKTPEPIVTAYRDAFRKAMNDPKFIERGKSISEDVSAMSPEVLTGMVKALADIPPEALGTMKDMLRKQGLNLEKAKKK